MKKRIFYLDFIRALSFIFIVIFHFNVSIGAHNIYVNSTNIPIIFYDYKNGNLGQIGVSLFFIISGAGLMLSNKENFNLKHFFNKRIFSLFPMFYLAYFLVTCYYFIRYASLNPFGVMRGKASFVWTILGMDGYLAPLIPNYYLLGEWFLGCIILLYCLFPVLRYLLIKMNKYVSILLVGLIYIITVQFYPFENYPIEFFVIARMLEFFFGMFVIMYIPKIKGLYLGGDFYCLHMGFSGYSFAADL